ncbi:MAG: peptidylprolyl isomerase [Pseudomonadota bacterium]
MHKLAAAFALLATPALSAGLEIDVAGTHTQGTITVDLLEDVAPNHVAQITALAEQGFYDNVYFHRVIDGFMAQTGDGQFAKDTDDFARAAQSGAARRYGTGGSDLPDIAAEFSDLPFERGVVGMARSQSPDSANSQFFIMFDEGAFLNGQYTVVGRVTDGLDVLDGIKRGDASTFQVTGEPDVMTAVRVTE